MTKLQAPTAKDEFSHATWTYSLDPKTWRTSQEVTTTPEESRLESLAKIPRTAGTFHCSLPTQQEVANGIVSFNKPQVPNCPWSMPDPHGGRSGPSEFEPGRIKSAYGLAREREFQCRIDENDATLRMALEVARNKILTGKYGGNSATSRQRQEQYRKNGDAALQAREEAMEGEFFDERGNAKGKG